MKTRIVRLLLLVGACLTVLLFTGVSLGQVGGGTGPMPRKFPHAAPTPPPSPGGPSKIRLTTAEGDRGPLTLQPKGGGFTGEFVVWNDGPGALNVSRVAVRTDDDDPRLPARFNARFSDGGGGSSIVLPHSSKRVTVTWVPEREPKLHQALGLVVLTSNDESAGEVAMGFVVPLAGPLSAHLLTWMLLLPLFSAVAALVMRVVGYKQLERLRALVVATSALQCVLAIVLYQGFNGAVTRLDGNDGFQYVERTGLVGPMEYYVGVDGTSVPLVLLAALVGLTAAIASYGVKKKALEAYYGFASLLLAAVTGVFIALDLGLFTVCWVVMLLATGALVSVTAKKADAAASRRLRVYGALSAVPLVFAVGALHLHSDPSFLVDGTRVPHSFAVPELMRVAYNAKGLTLLGGSFVKVVWGALFVAFGVLVPVVPLQRWLVRTVAEAPAPVAMLIAGVVLRAGVYGLVRVSLDILPDASRWAATTTEVVGVVTIAAAGVLAFRERDLRHVVACAVVGQTGFCLLGLGSSTREGIAGCLLQTTSSGLIVAVLFALLGALADRTKSTDVDKLQGVARTSPVLGMLVGGALLALAGAPGLSGFWGELLPLFGVFPLQRAIAIVAAVFAFVLAGSLVGPIRGLLAGPGEGASGSAPVREIGAREVAAVMPLVVICLGLGLYPGPFFTLVRGGVNDVNLLVNPPGPDEIALADPPDPRPHGAQAISPHALEAPSPARLPMLRSRW
jgi:NADH-quinone oxidoreductase subunit M